MLSMIMCIQNLVKFCPFILQIWSKNLILESIKGRNSSANLRKTTIYNNNVDLVNDDVYTKFGLILSIRSQDIEQKPNSDVNQGPLLCCKFEKKNTIYNTSVDLVDGNVFIKFGLNRSIRFRDIEQKLILTSIKGSNSVANLPKFELIQAFMHVLDTGKNEEDPIKMKALECSQDFSHYKSLGIFPDAQGQLSPQSLVRSGRISNSSEMLWMSLLPASMRKIRSKMKALEWTQH